MAVVERDIRRRAHDDDDALGVDAHLIEHAGVDLEVGEIVLLLEAGILAELLGPDAEALQPLGRDRVGEDHALREPAADLVLKDSELVVVHVRLGDAQHARGDRQVVRAVSDRQVEPLPLAEAAHSGGALDQPEELADSGSSAVPADLGVLHVVEREQLLRLCVVT